MVQGIRSSGNSAQNKQFHGIDLLGTLMARTARLFELMQFLLRRRGAVSAAVLPGDGRETVAAIGLFSGPRPPAAADGVALVRLRAAMRAEHRIEIDYSDQASRVTTRYVWPIALTFGNHVRLLAAWCELREDFRTFRVDRIIALRETQERYPRRRRGLLLAWRQSEFAPASLPEA